MSEDQTAALRAAREEGAASANKRALQIFGILLIVLVSLVVAGAVVAQRVRDQAPEVIEEIANERRASFEADLSARAAEAQLLATRGFAFMYRLWAENPALSMVRAHMDAATKEVRLLSSEVSAAIDSPTRNLGNLLERGPTRINAVLSHAVAVAGELKRVIPIVLESLKQAESAFEASNTSTIGTSLATLDGLLNPLMGEHLGLRDDWKNLRAGILAWTARVDANLEQARQQLTGDSLSSEFTQRLRVRVF